MNYYCRNNFIDADRKYKKALRYVDWITMKKTNCNPENLKVMKINSLLNLAAVRLKKHKYKDVIDICNQVSWKNFVQYICFYIVYYSYLLFINLKFQVLALDKNNGKALYRRAQGKLGLKDYDSALTDLNNALNYCPNDRNIQSKIEMTKKDKLKYLRIEREVCSKIFQ